jgi:hypothetical protein
MTSWPRNARTISRARKRHEPRIISRVRGSGLHITGCLCAASLVSGQLNRGSVTSSSRPFRRLSDTAGWDSGESLRGRDPATAGDGCPLVDIAVETGRTSIVNGGQDENSILRRRFHGKVARSERRVGWMELCLPVMATLQNVGPSACHLSALQHRPRGRAEPHHPGWFPALPRRVVRFRYLPHAAVRHHRWVQNPIFRSLDQAIFTTQPFEEPVSLIFG